jgi:hypothetical protein
MRAKGCRQQFIASIAARAQNNGEFVRQLLATIFTLINQ